MEYICVVFYLFHAMETYITNFYVLSIQFKTNEIKFLKSSTNNFEDYCNFLNLIFCQCDMVLNHAFFIVFYNRKYPLYHKHNNVI